MFLFHAGVAARASGHPLLAREWLAASLRYNPRFNPLYAPQARRTLGARR